MKINRVEPIPARGGHKFKVTFSTGTEIEVSAAELQSYGRFQRKVLEETGNHFRYTMADLLEAGSDIRTIQELLGHRDVQTMMSCTLVLNPGGQGVYSPIDRS